MSIYSRSLRRLVKAAKRKNKKSNQFSDEEKQCLLLCLPSAPRAYKIACHVFSPILAEYPEKIKAVANGALINSSDDINAESIIPFEADSFDKNNLLPDSSMEDLLQHPYEVAVDLNPEMYPVTANLINESTAKKKIGFKSKYSDYFFNVQVDSKDKELLEPAFRQIRNLIEQDLENFS